MVYCADALALSQEGRVSLRILAAQVNGTTPDLSTQLFGLLARLGQVYVESSRDFLMKVLGHITNPFRNRHLVALRNQETYT